MLEGSHISTVLATLDESNAWIVDTADDLGGSIAARVVDDQEFVVSGQLGEDRPNLLLDVPRSVVGGHADADPHQVSHPAATGVSLRCNVDFDVVRSFILRLAGFAGAPVLSALAPFIILPVISRLVGDGWASFSTGQSLGIFGMVLILFGWGVIGPVRVATTGSSRSRATILAESLRSRGLLAVIVVPACAAATFFISAEAYRVESAAMAAAMAVGGLTPAWYCIGEGNPRGLMVFDAAPKLVASAITLPVVVLTEQIIWYPIVLVALTVPAYAIHAVRVIRGAGIVDHGRAVGRTLRGLVPSAAVDATGNAYGTTPVPIATLGLTASDASAFASADRAYRIGLLLVVALGNAFQGWVLDYRVVSPIARQRLAIIVHVMIGAVGGFGIATLGPVLTGIVFGADLAAQALPSLFFGLAFFFISSATPLIRNLLVPAGKLRVVLASTITAAIVGIAVMVLGSTANSPAVISAGVATAEFVALAILIGPATRAYRVLVKDAS